MWYLAYNVLLLLVSPLILLTLLAKKRCRPGLAQRFGVQLPRLKRSGQPLVWVHAVSLGEVVAVAPLIRELHARYPTCQLVISTVTETGREAVEQKLDGVAQHCYAPLDFPWVVARFVEALRPTAFLFVETELWPNLLKALARRGVPSILVNGRLSSRSFRRYAVVRPFLRQVLGAVTAMLMQSDRDGERIVSLGACSTRVTRTGNIKFDQPLRDSSAGEEHVPRSAIGLSEDEELIVAGSTHPEEEDQILAGYEMLHREFSSLVLLLAPRHIERAAQLEATVKARGLPVRRRSSPGLVASGTATASGRRVIILDTRGELASVYRHAVLAFVGGTLVPVGGHNLLEPALWGKPVFFGPHTDHCAEIAELLIRAGGGVPVRDGEQLAREMAKLLRDRSALDQRGEAARAVVMENRGAVAHSLELIGKIVDAQLRTNEAVGSTILPLARTFSVRSLSFPRWALNALAVPYGLAVRVRAALYQSGWLPQRRLPSRVVSVGNLTVGGTGKTPVVISLSQWLLSRGKRVAVLSRGYRRHGSSPMLLVSDGRTIIADPAEAGDEPYLIAQRCPEAVVAVGANRYRLGRWVLERFPVDYFVLDDGFQHLALHRDVDLLLVDASDPTGLEALLPAGRLREPLSAAARATALVLTRCDPTVGVPGTLASLPALTANGIRPIRIQFRAEAFIDVVTGAVQGLESASGRAAVAFSGIGNVESFRRLLTEQGLKLVGEVVFADHHQYTQRDLQAIQDRARRDGAELVVTTEKDAVKIGQLVGSQDDGPRILALRLGTQILDGRDQLERLLLGVNDH